ncbi:MAG: MarR DNA-binding transcription regulator [Solirubrobacterales bacterium]|nr:MarR DNA-binding transcription regulator [Solirubrobacterales bacterium]
MTIHGNALLVAVSRLSITQTRAAGTAAKVAGVNPTSYAILSELALDGGLTNGQIAERLGMSTGGVTPALDRLERSEMIERNPNPADRRSSVVSITPRGQEVLRGAADVLADQLENVIDGMDERARETVLRFLTEANDAYVTVQERLDG